MSLGTSLVIAGQHSPLNATRQNSGAHARTRTFEMEEMMRATDVTRMTDIIQAPLLPSSLPPLNPSVQCPLICGREIPLRVAMNRGCMLVAVGHDFEYFDTCCIPVGKKRKEHELVFI